MIWATVSSWSCVCWLYRVSPSLAAKKIIWFWYWPSCDVYVLSCWKWVFAMTSAFSSQNSVIPFPASFCTPRPNLPVTPGIFLLLHSSPLWWKGYLLWVLVLEGLVGLHRIVQLQLLQHSGWGTDLNHCDTEWLALETNRDHSVIFEIVPKYCISDSLVDYEGYSISSKGFLSTVVDIRVIWVKFTHSCPFLKCQCSVLQSFVWPLLINLDSWT